MRLARAVGFSSVWASQHYLSDPFTYFQPLPTLGRMAAEAEGMQLGTGVLLLPLHQPVDLAEQLATLDVISGGRLIVGVGLGYRDAENEAMGVNPRERVGRFEEGLAALERLWSGEPVDYQGKHFSLRGRADLDAARCSGPARRSGWRPTPMSACGARPGSATPGS